MCIVITEQKRGTGAYRILRHLLACAGTERSGLDDIDLITPASNPLYRDLHHKHVRCLVLPARRDTLLQNMIGFWKIRRLIARHTVIHAWHSRGVELAAMASFLPDKIATATLHDHPSETEHSRQRRLVMRWSLRRVRAAVSVSHALAAAWRRYLEGKATIRVIHNGIPDFTVQRWAHDKVRVGFAGLYSPMKGIDVLIKWVRGIEKEMPVSWLLFGEPHPTVSRMLNSSGLTDLPNVQIAGHRRPEEIFSQVDILVHPSTGFDSLPTSLIEAACAGIPAVASRIGGAPEIIEHSQSGFLYSPDRPDEGMSYLLALIRSPELRRKMGEAARRIYERRFRVERMAREYAQFWREVARPSGQQGRPESR